MRTRPSDGGGGIRDTGLDGEEVEEEESSSDEVGQEETGKEKASKKNKKNDLKPFV